MPKHQINTLLEWLATRDLSLWSRVNFRSKIPDYLRRTSMSRSTPSNTFVDAGLSYQTAINQQITGKIYNLLDKTVDNDRNNTTLDGRRYTVCTNYDF